MEDRAAVMAIGEKHDLSRFLTLHHSLYIPVNFDAKSVANTLRREGYAAGVGLSAYQGSGINLQTEPYWLVLAEKSVENIVEEISEVRRFLEKLAEKYNGEYGGWEVV